METAWKKEIAEYMDYLRQEERCENTAAQYYKDILCFLSKDYKKDIFSVLLYDFGPSPEVA